MPNRLTLSRMVAAVRARDISPVELVDAHLKRIEAVNPRINAFIRLLADQARTDAKAAEEATMRGDPIGPLHGIPVTIKDSFDIAGLPTTSGSRLFEEPIAARDSTAVRRLRAAGGIPLGKTNCPEFLSSYESDNFIVGRTNNPWDLGRTSGGSSGGESAAIAAFCSAGGIGSDGGGSIRVPAHFTGIAGLKPTPGRVSATGHIPAMNHPGGLLSVAGPMARTAADVRVLFQVLSGYDFEDSFSAPVPLRPADLSNLRVGLMEQFYNVPVEEGVKQAVQKAARCLFDLKFPVEPFQPHGLQRAPNLWWFFFGELPARTTQALIKGREDEIHWSGTESLPEALRSPEATGKQVADSLVVRDHMRIQLLREMQKYPVLLLPVSGIAAFQHRQRRFATASKEIGLFEAMMTATWVNLLGLPAVTIPFGIDDRGLPVGVQLVGRPYEEETLLELAVRMEEARGPFAGPNL